MREFTKTRFDDDRHLPEIGHLPNLMDLMLVFAVGLIAALASVNGAAVLVQDAELGPELPELPSSADAGGEGLEALGQVYRDPDTGKLYVVR